MPEFWLIVKIHQDRVKVYSHSRSDIPQKMLLQHFTLQHVAINENSTGLPQTFFLLGIVLTISPFCQLILFLKRNRFMCAILEISIVPRCFTVQDVERKEDDQELPESLQLHRMVVRKIGEICRVVNQVTIKLLNKWQPINIHEKRNHQCFPLQH